MDCENAGIGASIGGIMIVLSPNRSCCDMKLVRLGSDMMGERGVVFHTNADVSCKQRKI
jgi:hypothetical protein